MLYQHRNVDIILLQHTQCVYKIISTLSQYQSFDNIILTSLARDKGCLRTPGIVVTNTGYKQWSP